MHIDPSVELENRPLTLRSNIDENGAAIVTNVETTTLDLHSLHVNNYNYQLQMIGKKGGVSKIEISISESDANVLSLACLNPSENVLEYNGNYVSLSSLGVQLGVYPIATMYKYCEVSAVPNVIYNEDGNFNRVNGFVEITFKTSSLSENLPLGSLLLTNIETSIINGFNKLISISGKSWDGIEIKLMTNSDGMIELSNGDSFWTQFVTRNEGFVVVPKVTGLDLPVDGSDAVNLDYVNQQVEILQESNQSNIDYVNQKIEELNNLIINQDSFFCPTEQRWVGSRAVAFNSSEDKIQLPNMSSLNNSSSVIGLALTNPEIDESGLTPEQIATSYNRRVYTSGIVKNVVSSWSSLKGNVYAGPNGTLLETIPTSGRIIKLGQKSGTKDILLAIQDYGYIYNSFIGQ